MTAGIHCPSRSLWEMRADTRINDNRMVHLSCNRPVMVGIKALAEVVYSFTRCGHFTEDGPLYAAYCQEKEHALIYVQACGVLDGMVSLDERGFMWRSNAVGCSRCGCWRALNKVNNVKGRLAPAHEAHFQQKLLL